MGCPRERIWYEKKKRSITKPWKIPRCNNDQAEDDEPEKKS